MSKPNKVCGVFVAFKNELQVAYKYFASRSILTTYPAYFQYLVGMDEHDEDVSQ